MPRARCATSTRPATLLTHHPLRPSGSPSTVLGDYAKPVVNQITRRAPLDPRFAAGPTAPSQEATGADGGYTAPPEVTSEVAQVLLSERTLFGQTNPLRLTRGSFVAPADATPPWAGPQAMWEGEGQPLAQTKMVLSSDLLKLHKLSVLIPITSELYEDAIGLDAYLRRAIPEKFDFKLTDALLSGTGVGQVLGALNAPALIVQTKEGGQAAGSIAYNNLTKMWNRMYAPARATAVWVMHPDAEMSIQGLTTPGGSPVIDYRPRGRVHLRLPLPRHGGGEGARRGRRHRARGPAQLPHRDAPPRGHHERPLHGPLVRRGHERAVHPRGSPRALLAGRPRLLADVLEERLRA